MRQKDVGPGHLEVRWTRGNRRTCIERLMLSPFEYVNSRGGTVRVTRTGTMKHLLLVLESVARDGGPCFMKLSTITDRMGRGHATVSRAIAACVGRGLLGVEVSHCGAESSRYQIVWDQVARVIKGHPQTADLIEVIREESGGQSPQNEAGESPAGRVESPQIEVCQSPQFGVESPQNRVESPQIETELSQIEVTDTIYTHERPHARSLNHVREPIIKPCGQTTLVEQSKGGWPHAISVEHLQDRESVHRLWEHALRYRFLSKGDRVAFFALAKYTSRMFKAGEIRDAGAYFTSQVKTQNWLGDHQDTKAAIAAITMIDAGR